MLGSVGTRAQGGKGADREVGKARSPVRGRRGLSCFSRLFGMLRVLAELCPPVAGLGENVETLIKK